MVQELGECFLHCDVRWGGVSFPPLPGVQGEGAIKTAGGRSVGGGRGGLFVGLLRQHGGVEPIQTQARVGGLLAEEPEQHVAALVVVDVDVAFLVLDQRQHVHLTPHAPLVRPRREREAGHRRDYRPTEARHIAKRTSAQARQGRAALRPAPSRQVAQTATPLLHGTRTVRRSRRRSPSPSSGRAPQVVEGGRRRRIAALDELRPVALDRSHLRLEVRPSRPARTTASGGCGGGRRSSRGCVAEKTDRRAGRFW